MTTTLTMPENVSFLDMQAALGVTKHAGGYGATKELLALCHIDQAKEVLNVGCGIGVASVYVAKHYCCHIVGIDIAVQMVAWSRQRAREEGVAESGQISSGRLTQPALCDESL